MSALLAALNHHLIQREHIPADKPLQNLADLENRIQQYKDPLSPDDLRTLVNLRVTQVMLTDAGKREPGTPLLIRSFAQTGYFDYASRLMDSVELYAQRYFWLWIAEAQAKAGLLDEALNSAEQIEHDDYDSEYFSQALVAIAKEMVARGDKGAESLFHIAANVSFPFMTINPPYAHPQPRFFHDLALAAADAGSFDFAIEMAVKIKSFAWRAAAQSGIAKRLFAIDLPRARTLIEDTLNLLKIPESEWRRENWYNNLNDKWQIVVLCEIAKVMYPVNRACALRLMQDAAHWLEGIHPGWNRDISVNTMAKSYVACGEGAKAFRLMRQIERTSLCVNALSEAASVFSAVNPRLADRAFKIALGLTGTISYYIEADRAYDNIARDMAECGRLEQALQVIKHHNLRTAREIVSKMIEDGYIAGALAHGFIEHIGECAEYIERWKPGLWLDCARDMAEIFSEVQPAWAQVRDLLDA